MDADKSPLIVSVSGIRGIVGESLTPEVAQRYATAFGSVVDNGMFVVGRDSRPSGAQLRDAVIAGLTQIGRSVIDIGIVPTPSVGFLVRERRAAGGLQISASHNPAQWNGLKLFGPDGAVLTADQGRVVQLQFNRVDDLLTAKSKAGSVRVDEHAGAEHLQRVLSLIDATAIASRRCAILLDANGGAGGPLGQQLLKSLGCNLIPVFCNPDGDFRHDPEPTPENLAGVAKALGNHPGAFAAALDPDADRLALIDENARCLSEELTLAFAVQYRLSKGPGPVAINLSTSRVIEDICAKFGVPCYRSAVGEANVVAKMREVRAVIGGEGNGGVIDPRVGWVRDPFIGLGLILSLMAESRKSLAELADELPQYHIVKKKFTLAPDGLSSVFKALKTRWPDAAEDTTDGLRLAWPDRWLHVRPSNTEPIVRVIAEAPAPADAGKLCDEAGAIVIAV